MAHLQIFAIDTKTGEREEIDSLYWFEEAGVSSWDGDGFHGQWRFEIVLGGVVVWESQAPGSSWTHRYRRVWAKEPPT